MLHNKGKWTTREAARIVGITRVTLQRWIAAGKIKPPAAKLIGAKGIRLWSGRDIAALKMIKRRIYAKGRGRKKRLA